jgi:hypothetical protein
MYFADSGEIDIPAVIAGGVNDREWQLNGQIKPVYRFPASSAPDQ